jgi:hypothetical protein
MKHLRKYESFESMFSRKSEPYEDTDTMAMFQLFKGDYFIAFGFRKLLIKDKEEINNLINLYNKTYKSEGEWCGGPINRKFDMLFSQKYKNENSERNFSYTNPYKPEIALVFCTDYGYYHIGFSVKSKKVCSLYSTTFDINQKEEFEKEIVNLQGLETTSSTDYYYNKVIDEMRIILNLFYNKKTLKEVSDYLNLNIDFDWNWSE